MNTLKRLVGLQRSRLPLLYSVQARTFKNPFVYNPGIDVRNAQASSSKLKTSSKDIFDMVMEEKQGRGGLDYKTAVAHLSDLAFVIIPFDRTQSEF